MLLGYTVCTKWEDQGLVPGIGTKRSQGPKGRGHVKEKDQDRERERRSEIVDDPGQEKERGLLFLCCL